MNRQEYEAETRRIWGQSITLAVVSVPLLAACLALLWWLR